MSARKLHRVRGHCSTALFAVTMALGVGALSAPASAGVLIGVIFPTEQHARVPFETKILKETAASNGDEVIVQFSNESAATQKNQVEAMIERGVNVLILEAIDADAANALVDQAHAAGIKVITYDRGVTKSKVDFHISRDNYEMGTLQAQSALKAAPCGKYAIIRGDKATIAQIDMSQAYDKLVKGKECVKVVHDVFVPGWETATAQREAEAALQANPDINVFLIMWDTGAQAVVQALKSSGVAPGTVWVTGSDATTPSLAYISQGWQGQTTWTPIDQMAKDAANLAHDLGAGVEPRIKGVMVDGVPNDYPKLTSVTKDNLCEYINKIAPAGWVNTDDVFGAGVNPCK
jgi:D-xylose transport system substrate-binding protein